MPKNAVICSCGRHGQRVLEASPHARSDGCPIRLEVIKGVAYLIPEFISSKDLGAEIANTPVLTWKRRFGVVLFDHRFKSQETLTSDQPEPE